jgi:hypothetical protein
MKYKRMSGTKPQISGAYLSNSTYNLRNLTEQAWFYKSGVNLDARQPIDWSSINNPVGRSIVTEVRSQQSCGCCYAMASTELAESTWSLWSLDLSSPQSKIPQMSAEDVLSCATESFAFTNGCDGGYVTKAVRFIITHGLSNQNSRSVLHNAYYSLEAYYLAQAPACSSNSDCLANVQYDFQEWCQHSY